MLSLHPELYWEHLGCAGSLAVSILVLICLGLRLTETPKPRMHIWAMIGFFVINACDCINALVYSDAFAMPNGFYMWNQLLIPGFMVSLYMFVRALTSAQPELGRRDVVHLLPFLLAAVCLAPGLALPGDERRGLIEGAPSDRYQSIVDLGENAFWSLWVVILIVYGTLCARRLIRHKRNVRAVFSDLEGKTLIWLDCLVATILVLASIVIIDEVRQLLGAEALRRGVVGFLFDFILPLSFGVFALRANPVLPGWSAPVLSEPDQDSASPPQGPDTAPRYARSGLHEDDLERLAQRLERRMTEGKLWRDHGLNLRGLASEIAVPPIHLSEVLNTRLGMSFYDYINQCRIRDACDLLVRTDDTILDISETVGFNAKSTFNTSFKKITGLTPSQWRAGNKP